MAYISIYAEVGLLRAPSVEKKARLPACAYACLYVVIKGGSRVFPG
jgi:hypothetical protein